MKKFICMPEMSRGSGSLQKMETVEKRNKNKGFTLIELIIVVAIMAVLVIICAPMYTKYIHKSRVATDWSNLRAYYDEIQADFVSTGEYNPKVLTTDLNKPDHWKQTEIVSLDGNTVKMQAGFFAVSKSADGLGYQISYYCDKCMTDWDKHKDTCILTLGTR